MKTCEWEWRDVNGPQVCGRPAIRLATFKEDGVYHPICQDHLIVYKLRSGK